MTITLHWWMIPVAISIIGIIVGFLVGLPKSEWDCFSPLIGLGIMICSVGVSLAMVFTKLFM